MLSNDYAFICTSYRIEDKNYYYTNYFPSEINQSLGTYVVDWASSTSTFSPVQKLSISKDSGSIYNNDISGNFKLSINFQQVFQS